MGFKQEKFKKLIEHKSGYTWGKEQELDKPEDGTVRVLTVTNIQEKLDLSNELYLKDVKDRDKKEKSVSKDWTIAVSSNGNRKRIGNAVFVSDDTDYLFASFLTAFKPKEDADIIPEYFFQWFSSHVVQERITSVSEGTTGLGNLDIRYLRNMVIEYPDNEAEQKAIATILSKVDEAIKATENSIKAAEKLKKSLMQNLLSGKLKPDGTWRKEDEFSYNEKVGYYPNEWNCNRFKEFSILQRGKDLTDNEVVSGSYPVVKSNGTTIYHNQYVCEPPGVVTGRSGTIGKAFFLENKYWPHNTTLYVKDFRGNYAKYIFYLIQTMRFEKYYAGTTVPTLNRNDIHRISVSIPKSVDEQKAICKIIDDTENILQSKQTKIKKLERLKKSLMQNLLTGKVRVDLNKIEKLINEN